MMPKINKPLFITLVAIISLFLFSLVKDFLLGQAVAVTASRITGAPVKIGAFSLGLLNKTVVIKGLKVYNPGSFPGGILIDLPKIRASYDLASLLNKKVYLPLVDVYIKEAAVIKNKDGNMNVNSLKFSKERDKGQERQEAQKAGETKSGSLRIDLLKLKVGKVIYKDFSQGDKPLVQVYSLNLDKEYRNITSPRQLAGVILTGALSSTAIKGVAAYNLAALAGVAFLPAGVAATFLGKDSAEGEFNAGYSAAFKAGLETLRQLGEVSEAQEKAGLIKANLKDTDVAVKISADKGSRVKITVSARKLAFPKPEIAEGVLYEISQKLR